MTYVGKSPADIIATAVDTTTGTFSGDLTVDTNTLYVDSANNRVGIGLSSNIDRKLHVEVDNTYAAKFGGTAGGDFAIEIGQTGTNGSAGFNATGTGGAMIFSISGQRAMVISSNGDFNLYEDTGSTPKLFWDSSAESLGIGKTDITTTSAFTVQNTDNSTQILMGLYNANGNRNFAFRPATDGNPNLLMEKNDGTDTILLDTDGDSYFNGGNVGIGTSSPSVALDVVDSRANSYNATADQRNLAMITARNPSDSTNRFASINLVQGGGTQAEASINLVQAGNYIGHLTFKSRTGGSTWAERMRIDSSGNLLVGTTDNSVFNNSGSGTGINLQNFGNIAVARDSNDCMALNRLNSDGDILVFNKDGTTVGGIGVTSSDQFYIARSTGNHGIKFKNSATMPSSSAGADADNAQDLGSSSVRWKDLYLSGGVYIGGTGGANYLSDYESGTFVPAFNSDSSPFPTVNYSIRTGNYTKIGNVVYYSIAIITSSVSGGSGNLTVSGLPFTTSGEHGLTVAFNFGWTANATDGALALNNQTYLRLFRDKSANSLNQCADIHHTTGNVYLTVNGVVKVN